MTGTMSEAKLYAAALRCIAGTLREIDPATPAEAHERNAGAIIARLAHLDPPLLLCTEDQLKDE